MAGLARVPAVAAALFAPPALVAAAAGAVAAAATAAAAAAAMAAARGFLVLPVAVVAVVPFIMGPEFSFF
eukprot:CAMPEP_0178711452 /NCGR_PEP_ID=MMETSP0699-20121125/18351_1 /TAXON_ID=265572 /ORGANISM="Extubocellulus spinifer, Strain CCMP396" /LENGTH=69 /DNA_ID=CAMNT_0020360127 /DNA_START=690 /DNA_END=899 /DNA_ORIENTATION=+